MNKKYRVVGLVSFSLAVIVLLIAIWPDDLSDSDANLASLSSSDVPVPRMVYGINIDSCIVIRSEVRKDQSLSVILSSYGVSLATIDDLARISRQDFDVRKIRAGNNYTMILADDSLRQPEYFVYEESNSDYVAFHLTDSLLVWRGAKPVDKVIRFAGGIITSSLWNAMIDHDTDPNLANDLSEIYAWTIDFFGLQKGDYYQVIYEDLLVEGRSIGLGRVLAANFHHANSDHFAFYFDQEGQGDYFDEQAGSLRRTFLKAPLKFRRISSKFSYSRMHPILRIRRPHLGVDYAAASGTPVHTIGDGLVQAKGWDSKGGGNYIKIKHNGVYTTTYMHLQGFARGLVVGKRVKQGDVIGYVGKTGMATGPHLDFRVYRNGHPIDPLKMESPPAKPVDNTYLEAFNALKDSLMPEIKQIPLMEFSDPVTDK